MEEKIRAASGSLFLVLSGFGSALLSFVTLVLLTRSLPKEAFGIWTFILSAAAFLYLFTDLGLDSLVNYFLQRYREKDLGRARVAYRVGSQVKFLLGALSVGGTLLLGALLNPSFFWVALLLACLTPYTYLSSILQSLQAFRFYAGLLILESLLRLGLVVLFVGFPRHDLGTLTLFYGLPYLLFSLGALARSRLPRGEPGAAFPEVRQEARDYWKWFCLQGVFQPVITQSQQLILGFLRRLSELADYGVATSLSSGLVLVSTSIRNSLGPSFLKKYDSDNLRGSLTEATRYSLLISAFFLAFIHFNATLLVLRFFSDRYLGAPLNLEIVSFGLLVTLVLAGMTPTALTLGRPDIRVKVMGVASLVTLASGGLLIPPYGSLGASLSFALGLIVANLFNAWSVHRLLKYQFPWGSLLRSGAAALGAFLPLQLVDLPPIPLLLLQFFGGAGLYLLLLRLTGELGDDDLGVVRETLRALVRVKR